jgi:hypothetical protein
VNKSIAKMTLTSGCADCHLLGQSRQYLTLKAAEATIAMANSTASSPTTRAAKPSTLSP